MPKSKEVLRKEKEKEKAYTDGSVSEGHRSQVSS